MSAHRLSIGLLLWAAACGGVGPRGRTQGAGELTQGVVANVDGKPIVLSEVERLSQHGQLTPRQALSRLEAEVLLAAEAERRGYGTDDAVEHLTRQAAVQALLEGDVEQKTPSTAEIDRAYANSGERFHTPERRVASHVLAPLRKNPTPEQVEAERVFIAGAVAKLRAAADPMKAIDAYRSGQTQPFPVRVEDLPPAPLNGAFVAEFSEAMFSLHAPGVVPQPVRTAFGWHAIVLREIQPESLVPEADARAQLQRELELAARKTRLDSLTRELQARTRVNFAEGTRETLGQLPF